MIEVATHCGRYGYRRITPMLRREGWKVNHERSDDFEHVRAHDGTPLRRLMLINGENFDTLLEAQVLTESWRVEYNTVRPHCFLGAG
jgi:transposase InsO family protein